MDIEREQWVHALSALPRQTLAQWAQGLPGDWRIQPKTLPQAGLGMLKMTDSAHHEAYYLGEFPFASAWLCIHTADGLEAEGAAQILDDDADYAEQLALCDAVLAAQLPGWQQVAEWVEQGMAARRETADERKALLARTRVDFSLLDDVGDDDADD